jgi:hypothetical protein
MQLITKQVPNDFNLFCFGDMHIGSVLYFNKAFAKMKAMMHRSYENCKENIAVCHGDCIEAICIDDPRYTSDSTIENSIFNQIKMAVKQMEGIKDQIVCLLEGNHETKLHRFGSIGSEIAEKLDVKFGTYTARITYQFADGTFFKHFATHGSRAVSSNAKTAKQRRENMENRLRLLLSEKSQTCALATMGHTHKLMRCPPEQQLYMDDNGSELTQHYTAPDTVRTGYVDLEQRWFANTGSFMKLYELGVSGYAERFGYDPIELGFIIVKVRNKQIVDIDKVVV